MIKAMLVLFRHKKKSYRMRVVKTHEHPGDRDRVEVSSKDMLGAESWSALPDGSTEVPHPEWLIRRALWHTLEEPFRGNENLVTIDIGET